MCAAALAPASRRSITGLVYWPRDGISRV